MNLTSISPIPYYNIVWQFQGNGFRFLVQDYNSRHKELTQVLKLDYQPQYL